MEIYLENEKVYGQLNENGIVSLLRYTGWFDIVEEDEDFFVVKLEQDNHLTVPRYEVEQRHVRRKS